MATSALTKEIARILRGRLAEQNENRTWFGTVIGRSQSHASQILLGNKAMTTDELELACLALRLDVAELLREADQRARSSDGPHAQSPIRDAQ